MKIMNDDLHYYKIKIDLTFYFIKKNSFFATVKSVVVV